MELTLVREDLKPGYQLVHPDQVRFDMFKDLVQEAIVLAEHASFIATVGPSTSPSRVEKLIRVPENRRIPDPPPAEPHPDLCPDCGRDRSIRAERKACEAQHEEERVSDDLNK